MREPQPFFRKQTQSWYLRLGKEWISLGKDETEAREQYHQIMTKRRERPQLGVDTVCGILNKYLNFAEANRSKRTFEVAEFHLKRFIQHVGRLKLARLRPYHVQQWLDAVYKTSDSYRSLAARTVKKALNWAYEMGVIDANPIARFKCPSEGMREFFLEPQLWPKFMAEVKSKHFADYVMVMLDSGLRPQEMHTAQIHHFDPKFGTLVFERVNSKGKKRRRVIPLNPISLEIVKRLVAERAGQEEKHLFLNRKGRPWNKGSVNCQMRRLKKKLKLPKLCATALRHSFAYYKLTVDGTDPLIVAKMMGHVDGRMIATRYGHIEANLDFLSRQKQMRSNPFLPAPTPPSDVPQLPADFAGHSDPGQPV